LAINPLGLSYGRLGLAMAVLGLVPLGYWLCLAWRRLGLAINPLGLGYGRLGLAMAVLGAAWQWLLLAWCRLATSCA